MLSLTSLAIAAGLLAANQDPGGSPGGVGLLPVQTENEAPPELVAGVDERMRSGLSSFQPTDVSAGPECAEGACMVEAAGAAGASVVVRITVAAEARDYILRTQLISGSTGEVLRADESYCEICTYDEVYERIDQEMANLSAPIGEALANPAVAPVELNVASDPAGAEVLIDGEVVGQTPLAVELEPGAHEISVHKDGFEHATKSVELAESEKRAVDFSLTKVPSGPSLKKILGWTGIGVGVAAIGAGVALLVIDENPYDPSCDGLEGTCARRYNTLGGGIAALAGGVVAAGAGATLLILDKRERGNLEAWIGPGGGGLRGRF
jgi:hypothetical protein